MTHPNPRLLRAAQEHLQDDAPYEGFYALLDPGNTIPVTGAQKWMTDGFTRNYAWRPIDGGFEHKAQHNPVRVVALEPIALCTRLFREVREMETLLRTLTDRVDSLETEVMGYRAADRHTSRIDDLVSRLDDLERRFDAASSSARSDGA